MRDRETNIEQVVELLSKKDKFLILTHKDPDLDGIGSMIALGHALKNQGKKVVLFSEDKLKFPLRNIKGSEEIIHEIDSRQRFDAVIALDCSDINRLGKAKNIAISNRPLINIDHHETNTLFGDINLVVAESSSTAELVFELIKRGQYPIDLLIAEDIFAAIQSDTGCFKYENTTAYSFRIASELLEYGVNPWDVYRNISEQYTISELKLLELALGTIELYHKERLGIISITSDMIKKAGACPSDSEKFVKYPRFISGVEIAALIRQIGDNEYKFSLRSNGNINVARLAADFGGGGHAKAAGFECNGELSVIKKKFIEKVSEFLK